MICAVLALVAVRAVPLEAQATPPRTPWTDPLTRAESTLVRHALRLHAAVPMVDGHNDFAWEVRRQLGGVVPASAIRGLPHFTGTDSLGHDIGFQTDIPRLRAGGVGAQFWSVWVPDTMIHSGAARLTMEEIDAVKRMEQRFPAVFLPARTAADIMLAHRQHKIASLIGMEGGHSIENSLGALRMFYDLGARYMTLTWNNDLPWADAAVGSHTHNGLTPFGREVVREMNRLGMLVDISHVSDSVMAQVLRMSEAPVIFSHSSARALADKPRDVPDDILRMVTRNGGVVMVNFYCDFLDSARVRWSRQRAAQADSLGRQFGADSLAIRAGLLQWERANPEHRPDIPMVADHIDHIRRIAGVDHVGYGSDFDGIDCAPSGLEDVSMFPRLTAELLRRGWSDRDVEKVIGLNLLRVMRGAEATARRLQRVRQPGIATLAMDSTGVSR